jgi:hypothetical protein
MGDAKRCVAALEDEDNDLDDDKFYMPPTSP